MSSKDDRSIPIDEGLFGILSSLFRFSGSRTTSQTPAGAADGPSFFNA